MPAVTCRTVVIGKPSRPRAADAWPRWKRRSFSKSKPEGGNISRILGLHTGIFISEGVPHAIFASGKHRPDHFAAISWRNDFRRRSFQRSHELGVENRAEGSRRDRAALARCRHQLLR